MGQSKQQQTNQQETAVTQTLDPNQQGQWNSLLKHIQGQQYQPYTGPMVADPNANQQAAWNAAAGIGSLGQDQMAAATNAAQSAAGYSPQMVSAQNMTAANSGPFQAAGAGQVGPIANVQAQDVSTAGSAGTAGGVYGNLRGNIRDVQAGQFGGLDRYMNEYNNQVVNSTLGDVDRARQMAVNSGGDSAAAAGAFGGSRHGVADSLTNEAYARESARTAADLRARGFDTAAALQQQDLNRGLQAGALNQGADAGLLGQAFGLTNQNALANQSANLQAGLANQGTALARGQTNAQLGTQTSIANMQGMLQNNQFNAGLQQQAGMANQNANLQAGMANQSAGLAGNQQQIAAGGLLGNLGAQAQGMGMNGMNALGWAGGQQFGIDQAGLDANYNQYLNQQGWNQQQTQNWMNALGMQPNLVNQNINSTNTQTVQRDRFGQILGGAVSLAGMGALGPIGGAIGGLFGGGASSSDQMAATSGVGTFAPWLNGGAF